MSNIDFNNINYDKKIPLIPTYVFTAGYTVTHDDINNYITSYINLIAYYIRFLHNNDKQPQDLSYVSTYITYNGEDVQYSVNNNIITYSLYQDNKYELHFKLKSNNSLHPSLDLKVKQTNIEYPDSQNCNSSYINNSTNWNPETKYLTFSYIMDESIYETLSNVGKGDSKTLSTFNVLSANIGNTYGYWGINNVNTYFVLIQNSVVNSYASVKPNNVYYDKNKTFINSELFNEGKISGINNVNFKYYLSNSNDYTSLDKSNFTYWDEFKVKSFVPNFTGNNYLFSYLSNPNNVKITNPSGNITFDSNIHLYGDNAILEVQKADDSNINVNIIKDASFNKDSNDYIQFSLSSKNIDDNKFKIISNNGYFELSNNLVIWNNEIETTSSAYCKLSDIGKTAIINSPDKIISHLDIISSVNSLYYNSDEISYSLNINLLPNTVYCNYENNLSLFNGEEISIVTYTHSKSLTYNIYIDNISFDLYSSYIYSYYYLNNENNKLSYFYIKSIGDNCTGKILFGGNAGLGYNFSNVKEIKFNIIGKYNNTIHHPEISNVYIEAPIVYSEESIISPYTVGKISNIYANSGPLALSFFNNDNTPIVWENNWAYGNETYFSYTESSDNIYEITYVSYKFGNPKIKLESVNTVAYIPVTKIISLTTFLHNYLEQPNLKFQYSDNKLHWDKHINSYAYFNINTYATPGTIGIINLSTRVYSLTNDTENNFYQFSNSKDFITYSNTFECDQNSLTCYLRVNPDSNYCIDNPEIIIKAPYLINSYITQESYSFTPIITKEIEFERIPEGLVLTYSETGEPQKLLTPGIISSFAENIGEIYYTASKDFTSYSSELPLSNEIPEGIGDKNKVISYYCYYMILPKEYLGEKQQTAYYTINKGNTENKAIISRFERFNISTPNEINIYGGSANININSNSNWSINISEE